MVARSETSLGGSVWDAILIADLPEAESAVAVSLIAQRMSYTGFWSTLTSLPQATVAVSSSLLLVTIVSMSRLERARNCAAATWIESWVSARRTLRSRRVR